jgi:tetratricopeptide (TPR) repeat protein
LLIATFVVAACAPTSPPPATVPKAEDRYLVDPRLGYRGTATPAIEKRFEAAWQSFLAGNDADARKRLTDIRTRDASYVPAALALAAIDTRDGKLDVARNEVDQIAAKQPRYTAAEVYQAEIAIAEKRMRDALDLYRTVATRTSAPPTARERITELETQLFNQLFGAANVAPDEEAIRLLREALRLQPGASAARILLVQKLVGQHSYDDARRELEPMLDRDADRADVQEALAEIDIGRGRYQEALVRYERLARRDAKYSRRFEEIKTQFAEANTPPLVRRALESDAVTRADVAVMMYWKVAAVRFAQNLPPPPIATDIGEAPGREEIIRAIALGIFQVDQVTRRVGPFTPVTNGALARIAARLLATRGATCARGLPAVRDDLARAEAVLKACGVRDPFDAAAAADAPANGRITAAVMEDADRALSR